MTVHSTVVSNLSEFGLFSDCLKVSTLLQTVQVHLVGQQADLGQEVHPGQEAQLALSLPSEVRGYNWKTNSDNGS